MPCKRYIVIEVDADDARQFGEGIIFVGPSRDTSQEPSLSRMVKIKEKVKEVYSKLKQLHVKKNVNLYYDLLDAILKR